MSIKSLLSLILIFLFFSIVNISIISQNQTPLAYDESDYFLQSFYFYNLAKNLFKVKFLTTIKNAVFLCQKKADILPLFPLSISYGHFLPGFNQYFFPLVNFFYLGLLMFLMYKLGTLLKDEQTGILSAFITISMPVMFAFSRTLFMDFAFTTVVVLNFYLILKTSRSFSLKNLSFLGLSTAAGMLYKYTFPIYTFIPICILFISSPGRKRFINFAAYFSLVLLIVSPFYLAALLNKTMLLQITNRYILRNLTYSRYSRLFSFRELFFYLQIFRQRQIGNFYFFLFFISIIHFLFNKSKHICPSLKLILLSWLIVPYLTIIGLPFPIECPNSRHILPLLPVIALLIAFFVMEFKKAKIKYTLCALIIIVGSARFITLSFKKFLHPQKKLSSQKIYIDRCDYGLLSPYTIDFKQKAILKTIKKFGPTIVFIPDTPYPALISSIKLESKVNNYPLTIAYIDFYKSKNAWTEINETLENSKCVVLIRSHKIEIPLEGGFQLYAPQTHNLLIRAFKEQQVKFKLHKKFILSDKDVYVYVKLFSKPR